MSSDFARHLSACVLLLTAAVASAAEPLRAPLDVWCVGHCPNETAFWSAYAADQGFRRALDERFVVRRLPIAQLPVQALLRGIIAGPTFTVPGRPHIIGFRGPAALLNELGLPAASLRGPPLTPPEDRESIVDPAEVKESLSRELLAALEAAREADRKQFADQIEMLRRRLSAQETGGGQLDRDVLLELQRIAGELDDLRRRTPPTVDVMAPDVSRVPPPDPEPVPRAPLPPTDRPVRPAPGRLLGAFASALPWLVPFATGTGGVGALLGAAWWLTRLSAGKGSSCGQCRTYRERIAELQMQAAREPSSTKFVPIESDAFRLAYEYAVRETVSKFPGARDLFEQQLQPLITQYLAAERIRK